MLFSLALALTSTVLSISFSANAEPTNESLSVTEVLQRNADIAVKLAQFPIRGVRKMSEDEGEKFFLEYWDFDGDAPSIQDISPVPSNVSGMLIPRSYSFRSAFSLHTPVQYARDIFLRPYKRDFQCPGGTYGCSSINRPESCCAAGDVCELVQWSGSQAVGCCPAGVSCSGPVGSCSVGYSTCPESLGGGCCIPGYECISGGCARISTVTVTVHPSSSSSAVISPTTISSPAATYSTDSLVPPARPTGSSEYTTTQTTSSSGTGSICPTGFYACSAVYHGGCCRTGRNCDTTSCPALSSSTFTSNSRTIVVAEPTTATGPVRCANGWFSCADTAGGGCCPSGFACGSSCVATVSATGASASASQTVAKAQPQPQAQSASCLMFQVDVKMLGISVLGTILLF